MCAQFAKPPGSPAPLPSAAAFADPLAGLESPEAYMTGLAEPDDWMQGLEQVDDVPDFNVDEHPEIDPTAKLSADRGHIRTPTRRLFVDYRSNADAYRHLDPLPTVGESLHGVISGKYALFDLIPAVIERTEDAIDELHILTLGFSKRNGSDLCGMLDGGQIKRAALICSYYFEKTSSEIYDAVVPEMVKRGQRVKALRTHAKMLLMRMAGGTCYVVESSANLRSCANVEQFVMTCCPALYRFHQTWVEDEILRPTHAKKKGVPNAA